MENQLIATSNKQALIRPIASIEDILIAQEERVSLITRVLKNDVDYGVIEGTKKPSLYKAGAERLCNSFGAHPEYEVIEAEKDHDRAVTYQKTEYVFNSETRKKEAVKKDERSIGAYRYVIKCNVVSSQGKILASSIGSCSSYESKYVSRPRDSENTVLKMAQKRAFVSATLNAFGLSDRFTVDVEDFKHTEGGAASNDNETETKTTAVEAKRPERHKILFDVKNNAHIEWCCKMLAKACVSEENWDDICVAMDGKTQDHLQKIIKETQNKTVSING